MASSSEHQGPSTIKDESSYFYRVVRNEDDNGYHAEGERFLATDSDITVPSTQHEIHAFISTYPQLGHGDVLSFSDYRAAMAFIVQYDDTSGQFGWITNPDDSASGYLTIPLEILHTVSHATAKYHDIIQHHPVNIHLPSHDHLLKVKFGNDIPTSWQFDLHYVDGQVMEFYVKLPGCDWKSCPWDTVNWEQLVEMSQASGMEKCKFNVRIKLVGDSVTAYKGKYQPSGAHVGRMAWLAVKPKFPPGWEMVKGRSSSGPNHKSWIWKCEGPVAHKEEARERVTEFLQGFPHELLPGNECSLD